MEIEQLLHFMHLHSRGIRVGTHRTVLAGAGRHRLQSVGATSRRTHTSGRCGIPSPVPVRLRAGKGHGSPEARTQRVAESRSSPGRPWRCWAEDCTRASPSARDANGRSARWHICAPHHGAPSPRTPHRDAAWQPQPRETQRWQTNATESHVSVARRREAGKHG